MRRFALAVLFTLFAGAVQAATTTVTDLTPRTDILGSTTYGFDLGDIDETATNRLRVTLRTFNSNGNVPLDFSIPSQTIDVSINSLLLTNFEIFDLVPGVAVLDISFTGLLLDGLNTITMTQAEDFTTGTQASYSSRDLRLSFTQAPIVPLPAAVWMLLAGLGGLGALRYRRSH